MAAYLKVTLNRIADPTVPDGCLLTVSATQFPALDAEGQAMVRAMIDGLRAMLQQALLAAGPVSRRRQSWRCARWQRTSPWRC
ncbi:hypothetical protein NKG94_22510 [Micromonospora sp. M12]